MPNQYINTNPVKPLHGAGEHLSMCFRNQLFFSPGPVLLCMGVVERKERTSHPQADLQNTRSGHPANGEERCSDLQGTAQENPF